jgi:hypothetical protein
MTLRHIQITLQVVIAIGLTAGNVALVLES